MTAREPTHWRRFVDDVKDARDVITGVTAIGSVVVGAFILIWGMVSANPTVGLGGALLASLVLNAVLFIGLRYATTRKLAVGPIELSIEDDSTDGEDQRLLLRALTGDIVKSFERFEFDWQRGLDSAQNEARRLVTDVAAKAVEVHDDRTRAAVTAYVDRFHTTPPGWWEEHGATAPQIEALRRDRTDAVDALGENLRALR